MTRLLSFTIVCVCLFSLLVIVSGITPVYAMSYELTATWASELNPQYDFTVVYEDMDGDHRMDDAEAAAGLFSGFQHPLTADRITSIFAAPAHESDGIISPYTDGTGTFLFIVNPPAWWFRDEDGGGYNMPSYNWEYTQQMVHLPPTVLLLGFGLIPLAWFRRTKPFGK